jgi:hypothetical protein
MAEGAVRYRSVLSWNCAEDSLGSRRGRCCGFAVAGFIFGRWRGIRFAASGLGANSCRQLYSWFSSRLIVDGGLFYFALIGLLQQQGFTSKKRSVRIEVLVFEL